MKLTRSMILVFVMMCGVIVGDRLVHADTLGHGTWQNVEHPTTKGGWRIVENDGKRYLDLTDDFQVERAPDLKIFLSPLAAKDLRSSNATRGARRIAVLTTHKGAARFELPSDVALEKFHSLALQCEKYSVLFAKSSL